MSNIKAHGAPICVTAARLLGSPDNALNSPPGGPGVTHTVPHATPMLSLGKIYGSDQIRHWIAATRTHLGVDMISIAVQDKLDGIAVNLRYVDGVLTSAASRGTGMVGENITNHLKCVPNIAQVYKIKTKRPGLLEVRGELVIPKGALIELNRYRCSQDIAPYTDTRSAVSGLFRMKNPAAEQLKYVDFVAHGLGSNEENKLSITEEMDWLDDLGFACVQSDLYAGSDSVDRIVVSYDYLACVTRSKDYNTDPKLWVSDYDIDGIVLKIDDKRHHERLGSTRHHPHSAIAVKFSDNQYTTTVTGVAFTVGRHGIVTPVAQFSPIDVSGVRVSRATLRSQQQLQRLGLAIGDTLLIERRGGVIPQVVSASACGNSARGADVAVLETCPCCGSDLVVEDGVPTHCPNHALCADQVVARAVHFVSAMDYTGLSDATIKRVYPLVQSDTCGWDLIFLALAHPDGLTQVERKVVTTAIAPRHLSRFIYGLSIRNVGRPVAEKIASLYTLDIDEFLGSLYAGGVVERIRSGAKAIEIGPKTLAILEQYDWRGLAERMIPHLNKGVLRLRV